MSAPFLGAEPPGTTSSLLTAHWGTVGTGSGMPVAVVEQVSAVADGAAG